MEYTRDITAYEGWTLLANNELSIYVIKACILGEMWCFMVSYFDNKEVLLRCLVWFTQANEPCRFVYVLVTYCIAGNVSGRKCFKIRFREFFFMNCWKPNGHTYNDQFLWRNFRERPLIHEIRENGLPQKFPAIYGMIMDANHKVLGNHEL